MWDEAMGDVLKVTEVVEFACGIPQLMKGPALMNCTTGYDTTQYLEPVGVFAGIAPWNFPAMIPMGWMAPLCIATGNTMVLKAASFTPQRLAAHRRAVGPGRAAQGRHQRRHLLAPRGRDPAQTSRHQGRVVRRLHRGRPAHLRDRGRGRQAGAGADRGQEPCAGAAGRRARTLGARHHQLGVRLRGRALHGAAGGRRRRGHRGRAGGDPGAADAGAEDRPGVRQDEPTGAAGQRRTPPVGHQMDREGRRRGRNAGAGRPRGPIRAGLREWLLPGADAVRPRDNRA